MALDPILDLPIANPLSGSEWTPVVQLQGPPFFPVEVTCRTTVAAIGLLAEAATVPWPVSIGGTGNASLAQYGLLYGNGTSPIGVTAVGLSSQVLVGNSAAAPSWSGGTEGELLTVHSGAVSWLPAGVNGQVLAGSSGTLPTWVQGTSGQYLGINGAGNVAFLTSGGPTTVTTISFDGSGLTPDVPAQGDVVMGGILNAATGGTGNSSLTADAVLIGNGTVGHDGHWRRWGGNAATGNGSGSVLADCSHRWRDNDRRVFGPVMALHWNQRADPAGCRRRSGMGIDPGDRRCDHQFRDHGSHAELSD